jgi:hypothetical protein
MKKINAVAAFSFTSSRVRGEVGIERSEMPGEGGSPRIRFAETPPHPSPLPAGGERGRYGLASGWRH